MSKIWNGDWRESGNAKRSAPRLIYSSHPPALTETRAQISLRHSPGSSFNPPPPLSLVSLVGIRRLGSELDVRAHDGTLLAVSLEFFGRKKGSAAVLRSTHLSTVCPSRGVEFSERKKGLPEVPRSTQMTLHAAVGGRLHSRESLLGRG